MNDVDKVFRDIDQKHNSYTRKFGLIKSRFDKLQGEIDELRALLAEYTKAAGTNALVADGKVYKRRGKA